MNKKHVFLIGLLALLVLPGIVFAQSGATGRGRSRVVNHDVQVIATARGATVFIDGEEQTGTTPRTYTVQAGTHTFRVEARGYLPWEATVNVDSDMTINAELEQETFPVRIRATNANNAVVFLEAEELGGSPVTVELPRGTYRIVVNAPGFQRFQTNLVVNGAQTLNVTLEPMTARIRFDIPDEFLNTRVNNPREQISIYVDGRRVEPGDFDVIAGTHEVEIVSGGLRIVTNVTFTAGEEYSVGTALEFLFEAGLRGF